MAYGSFLKGPISPVVILYYNNSYNNTQNLSGTYESITTRSGTNATVDKKNKALKPWKTTFVTTPCVVNKGPRLTERVPVYNRKLDKVMYVWKRAPLIVYKTKKVRTKVPYVKGLNLPPNELHTFDARINIQSTSREVTGKLGTNTFKYVGDLWDEFMLHTGYYNFTLGSPKTWWGDNFLNSRFNAAMLKADNNALVRLYPKVKKCQVNLAVAIGERAQTAGMLRDLTLRLARGILALRKGNVAKAAKVLFPKNGKGVANDWLCVQYGIKPLISDIEGVAKTLTDSRPLVFRVKTKRREELPLGTLADYNLQTGVRVRTVIQSHGYVEVSYTATLQIDSVLSDLVVSLSRLGLTNLSTVVWELIPFSFIVDWFIPIGEKIMNEDAFTGLQLVQFHKTVFYKEYITVNRTWGGYDQDGRLWSKVVCLSQITKTRCDRTIPSSVPPLPKLEFKDPVSKGHIANALALLTQMHK